MPRSFPWPKSHGGEKVYSLSIIGTTKIKVPTDDMDTPDKTNIVPFVKATSAYDGSTWAPGVTMVDAQPTSVGLMGSKSSCAGVFGSSAARGCIWEGGTAEFGFKLGRHLNPSGNEGEWVTVPIVVGGDAQPGRREITPGDYEIRLAPQSTGSLVTDSPYSAAEPAVRLTGSDRASLVLEARKDDVDENRLEVITLSLGKPRATLAAAPPRAAR